MRLSRSSKPIIGWKNVPIPRDLHAELASLALRLDADGAERDSRRARLGVAEITRIAIRKGIEVILREHGYDT